LQRIKDKADVGLVAAHSLAEMYAVLTTLPVRPRIPPAMALRLIQENVLETCEVVSLSEQDYRTLIQHLADAGIIGDATYDALLLHAAWKAGVDQVVTLNAADFRRVYPALKDKIVSPLAG
jgi:predicted nucleic acid-binding protein